MQEMFLGEDMTPIWLLRIVVIVAGLTFTIGCGGPLVVAPHRIKVAEVDAMGDVSADGRLLTYVDWDTGDLALRDLVTGRDRKSLPPSPNTRSSTQMGHGSPTRGAETMGPTTSGSSTSMVRSHRYW
jgi:hypothetical protein